MRLPLDLLYRIRKRTLALLRIRTRGVKVMLFDDGGALLLVRHGYGRSDLFELPGGGIRPFEGPTAAARREISEELGCGIEDIRFVSTHVSRAEGRRDTIQLFAGRPDSPPVPDGRELIEARFFPLDALPAAVSPSTLRRIAECRGDADPDGTW